MTDHAVVSREEWLQARRTLLAREKEETRLRDAVNAERLALPWVKLDKDYRFQTPSGEKSLSELFDGRSQLVVYHFMLGPDWEAGCPGCSFVSETFDGTLAHLNNHDVTFTAVSRAPLDRIEAYRRRMGWHFPWVSSNGSDFNYDFGVSLTPEQIASGEVEFNYKTFPSKDLGEEQPGMSAFYRDADGEVFHTYSSYSRGLEQWIGTLMILDRAPLGRNENSTMNFVRRHDEYQQPAPKLACH
ncbi:DUF899 domain-containing protein [Nostoc sp. 3335mG]|nr:DUF899 domain-containing protein [Nostoc sp. 3335mG]